MKTPTSNYNWQDTFLEIYDRCVAKYRAGNDDFNSYYTPQDLEFLTSVGYKPRELFDFVEDVVEMNEPSRETALLIAAVRRDFLATVQQGKLSQDETTNADLPARDSELGGFVWLPRIITKARAKLKGELHPDVMFGCGGDRNFLKTHDINPADFLRVVWAAHDDDSKIAAYVKTHSGA